MDDDFFYADSHCRLSDLLYAAEREGAVVWRGQVLSNRLQVVHAEPGTALGRTDG